jgi:hypothetical protein
MINLLLSTALWASPLGESETSYIGASILEGDVDVTFSGITDSNYEYSSNTYAFFEGNTLYAGNSDDYGNSVDTIVEFFWFQSSIDRGSDFYVAVIKARATPGSDCPGWQSLWVNSGCELWADDWGDWGEYPVLSIEAMTDIDREQGAFRWDWAVPFENYGIDAYGQVTFSNQYGIGANAEGAVMAHGEIPLDESGNVQAAGNVQVKGYLNSEYKVQTQYEVTLYEWDVFVNGRADLMAWDTFLNLGVRAEQSAYHEYFMSIQVEQGESFIVDEVNLVSNFDIGNLNPFAKELGLSIQNMEISAPFWEPPEEEAEGWDTDTGEYFEETEEVEENIEMQDTGVMTEEDTTGNSGLPSLSSDGTPIKSGCDTAGEEPKLLVVLLAIFVFFVLIPSYNEKKLEVCS